MSPIDCKLRSVKQADEHYLRSTFALCLQNANFHSDKNLMIGALGLVLDKLLKRFSIIVACDKDEPNMVLGWIMFNDNELAFIYVKRNFRQLNVGTTLIHAAFPNMASIPIVCLFSTASVPRYHAKRWNLTLHTHGLLKHLE